MPNLLDHAIKKELDSQHVQVVIGVILGRVDGKIIEISNCFPLSLKSDKEGSKDNSFANKNDKLNIDKEYLKKMIRFHKTINKTEAILGVYISSTELDTIALSVLMYFRDLFIDKEVRSPLQQPIILQYDPTLKKNKLDIKILNIASVYLEQCPMFAELPYKFQLDNFDMTGLDVLFYGQEHCDTMSILSDKRENLSADNLKEIEKNQQLLQNRELMLRNFKTLIENLDECDTYIQSIIDDKEKNDPNLGRIIKKSLGQFTNEDMAILQ